MYLIVNTYFNAKESESCSALYKLLDHSYVIVSQSKPELQT